MRALNGPRQALDRLGSGDLSLALRVAGIGRMGDAGSFGNRPDGDLLVLGNQLATGRADLWIGDIQLVPEGGRLAS